MKRITFALALALALALSVALTQAATKTELLTDLAGKVTVVGTPALVATQDNVAVYDVPVLQTDGNTADRRIVPIYVVDEGEETEAAYYRQDPDRAETDADAAFRVAGQSWLDARVQAGTILRGNIVEADLRNRFMVCRAFFAVNGTAEMRYYLVRRNAANTAWDDFYQITNWGS